MGLYYRNIPIPVLFENEYCLILNKPSGLPVQGGQGVKVSLDSILSQSYSSRPLLVHRLDRDTSGIILVAKTKEAAGRFSVLFAGTVNRTVVKRYLGVCSGVPDSQTGVLKTALAVRGKGGDYAKKESKTFFRLLAKGEFTKPESGKPQDSEPDSFSLLELELGTGRIHQIRRHLAQAGHPLLGDDKYGDFSLNKILRKTRGLKQLLLHASRLIIPDSPPMLPHGIDVSAPLPDSWNAVDSLSPIDDTLSVWK